jgi:hypothetical protein
MFSSADVSFCLGVLDSFGDHPASACSLVRLFWDLDGMTVDADALASLIAETIGQDPWLAHASADPVVTSRDARLEVEIHALPGHMGSHDRDSDAIAKAAAVMGAAENAGLGLPRWPTSSIHLEGGQGFLPDRSIDDIRSRLTATFHEALDRVREGMSGMSVKGSISFDKLHNDAFASDPDAPTAPALASAVGQLCDIDPPPVAGWKASCDARIIASRCRDVVTFGPGRLEVAHGPHERITIDEVVAAGAAIALAVCTS